MKWDEKAMDTEAKNRMREARNILSGFVERCTPLSHADPETAEEAQLTSSRTTIAWPPATSLLTNVIRDSSTRSIALATHRRAS